VKRYGQYERKASWIVKRYGQYGRKVGWIVKCYAKYERKVIWNVKWYGKYGIRFGKYRRKLWNDLENMEEKSNSDKI
jgi:hypothetical protein